MLLTEAYRILNRNRVNEVIIWDINSSSLSYLIPTIALRILKHLFVPFWRIFSTIVVQFLPYSTKQWVLHRLLRKVFSQTCISWWRIWNPDREPVSWSRIRPEMASQPIVASGWSKLNCSFNSEGSDAKNSFYLTIKNPGIRWIDRQMSDMGTPYILLDRSHLISLETRN